MTTSQSVTPSSEWHFANGSTSEPLDVFLLAYNPAATAVRATFTFYRSAAETPVATERTLQPGRTTVWLNADERRLAGSDFAVTVHADASILIDRGLRWQPPGRTAPQEQATPGASLPCAGSSRTSTPSGSPTSISCSPIPTTGRATSRSPSSGATARLACATRRSRRTRR